MVEHTTLYHRRLQKVIDFIYQNLDQPLDLNRLAEVACMSPYHWHRVYQGIYGESIVSTVRRLRLQRAAGELVNSDNEIKQIAKHSGYSGVHAFNRVFNQHYGLPPAKYRQQGSHKDLQLLVNNSLQGSHNMSKQLPVKIVNIDALSFICQAHQGSYMDIGNAFEKLFGWVGMQGLFPQLRKTVGIYYDDPGSVAQAELRSLACIQLQDNLLPILPSPIQVVSIAAGKYAVLQHKGPYSDMQSAYQWLYSVWLPESGLEIADQPCFEEYLNNPREVAATELLTDIYLPLKP
ncbi:MAG: AraC family transcriptional regulator [Oceanospirillaceae bacterium]